MPLPSALALRKIFNTSGLRPLFLLRSENHSGSGSEVQKEGVTLRIVNSTSPARVLRLRGRGGLSRKHSSQTGLCI